MDNKDFEEKNEELTEETTEEMVEEVEEAVEEAEETVEEVEKAAEEIEEALFEQEMPEEQGEELAETGKKPKKPLGKVAVALITAVITAVIAVFGTMIALGEFPQIYNKYNKCTNTTGRTVKDIADQNGITVMKLLRQYGLPLDMPENTNEASASYLLTIGDVAEMNKLSVDELKEKLSLGEEVTDEAIWGAIEDDLTLAQYVGEANLEEFKKEYDLSDSTDLETKFKKVRSKVYKAMQKAENAVPEKDFNIIVKHSVLYNKYNDMGYIDTDGTTVADYAQSWGVSVEDFLKELGLPEDMPGNTSGNAFLNIMPIGTRAGGEEEFAELKEKYEIDDSVTMDTPWGEAMENVKLRHYVGEENFDRFKELYGFGDDVTLDTTWGEVRVRAEQKQKEMYAAQQAGEGR